MARMTYEMRARLEAFKAVRVKHPRLEEVDRAVMGAIEEHAGYSHVLLYGPSGAGKSTVMHHVTARCLEEEPNRAIVPVVFVEARSSDIGAYARLDYYRQVLSALREHAAVKDRLVNVALSARPTQKLRDAAEWLDMREAVEYALERLQVKAVVIDEAQHLMQVEAHHKPVDQLNWLKSVSNRTNVLHILVGTYDLFDFRNLDGQAARRGRDLHFPRYHLEHKEERKEFVGALRYLLEHVPLTCDVESLLSDFRTFADLSIGCIGILRDWLVDTVAALFAEGETSLTIEALKRYALQPAQRVRLEMEARTGERKVEMGNANSHRQLQALLAKPVRGRLVSSEMGTSSEALIAPPTEPRVIDQPPKERAGRVIERAASRDPVGETPLTLSSTKCSFKGIIDLSPGEMKETGISRVECPECATTRSLSTEGSQVRFPPHDKRKTRTPSREERWVRQGTSWKLDGARKGEPR
jgi:KaiC/GvpD/RAD55 family RecA-like ATPase